MEIRLSRSPASRVAAMAGVILREPISVERAALRARDERGDGVDVAAPEIDIAPFSLRRPRSRSRKRYLATRCTFSPSLLRELQRQPL